MNTQKIFVVDSDPEVVDMVMSKLEAFGFECHAITSVDQAEELISFVIPDLIVMDLGFAQQAGLVFINRIKKILAQEEIAPPIAVINGPNDPAIKTFADDLGTTDLFADTYDADSLQSMLMDYQQQEDLPM
jgi:DNA-binding response OmpR family regulator